MKNVTGSNACLQRQKTVGCLQWSQNRRHKTRRSIICYAHVKVGNAEFGMWQAKAWRQCSWC